MPSIRPLRFAPLWCMYDTLHHENTTTLPLTLINLAIRRHETSLTYESLRIKVRSSVECVKIQVTPRWVD